MDERRIHSSTRPTSPEVTRATFTTVRKGGFDPQEVRFHLEAVAREMAHLESRVRDLQSQLAEALQRAANPTIDEATLASALGSQSAAILRSAHEEAGRVTAEAQERSAQLFAESQQRAAAHVIEAQERAAAMITEAENSATQVEHDARLAAERLIDSAKVNGEALVERGREQGRAIVDQANEARKTVLNDLAVKRKALHLQIEQLRAARDSLSSFVASVREQVDTVIAGLTTSDEAARTAALEALRLRPPSPEPTEEELLAGTPLREVPEVVPVEPGAASEAPKSRARKAPRAETAPVEDESSGTDVVNEIFARLRKATLEERGATAPAPKKAPVKHETPVGELFARRDGAIEESLAALTRRVKRVLQDDQNAALERLRDVKGMITTELEDELAQRARYAEAAHDALADAAAAGARFAFDEAGVTGAAASPAALNDYAADLAVTIVLALRKRILADGSGTAVERANTAYKEWRGARVERLCTDAARRAFHLGVLAASQGHPVRFVVAPTDAPCDACALDARSGERPAGQGFPSGSAQPPLHAGCACAVVPA
ncbi:MAG: DivIVA domain-containing protein [Acidobacteriota bacterium]|nr:DivIVA domain-containing protein [Acidobacteriota bacterium]